MYKISDYPQIEGNFYLAGRGVGACRALVGTVDLLTVFLKRSPDDWSATAKERYFAAVSQAADLLMREAKRYGAPLTVRRLHLETTVPETAKPTDGYALVKDFFHAETVDALKERYKSKTGASETPILLALRGKGRSFAYKKNSVEHHSTQEISVLFFEESVDTARASRVIAHELLHQFGAVDYYFPQRVKETAEKYIVDSIMGVGKPIVDDLTAYLIGWKDTVSASSYWFLKHTMWMDAAQHEDAKNKLLGTSN